MFASEAWKLFTPPYQGLKQFTPSPWFKKIPPHNFSYPPSPPPLFNFPSPIGNPEIFMNGFCTGPPS